MLTFTFPFHDYWHETWPIVNCSSHFHSVVQLLDILSREHVRTMVDQVNCQVFRTDTHTSFFWMFYKASCIFEQIEAYSFFCLHRFVLRDHINIVNIGS